jgi:glycerol dehydrogenase-like iron-containing ADH family enzyme
LVLLIIGIFILANAPTILLRAGFVIQIANWTVMKFASLDTGLNTHHQIRAFLLL